MEHVGGGARSCIVKKVNQGHVVRREAHSLGVNLRFYKRVISMQNQSDEQKIATQVSQEQLL